MLQQVENLKDQLIEIERGDHFCYYEESKNLLYISNNKSNSIQIFEPSKNRISHKISLERPRKLIVNNLNDKLYAICGFTDYGRLLNTGSEISIIDLKSFESIKTIGERSGFSDLFFDERQQIIYAASKTLPGILLIDSNSDKVIDQIKLKAEPDAITLDPISKRLFVADPNSISVIDTNNNKTIDSVNLYVNALTTEIFVNTKLNKLYFKRSMVSGDAYPSLSEWIDEINMDNPQSYNKLYKADMNNEISMTVNPRNGIIYVINPKKKKIIVISNTSKVVNEIKIPKKLKPILTLNTNMNKLFFIKKSLFHNYLCFINEPQ